MKKDLLLELDEAFVEQDKHKSKWVTLSLWIDFPAHYGRFYFDSEEECQSHIDRTINKARNATNRGKKVFFITSANERRPFKDLIISIPYPVKT